MTRTFDDKKAILIIVLSAIAAFSGFMGWQTNKKLLNLEMVTPFATISEEIVLLDINNEHIFEIIVKIDVTSNHIVDIIFPKNYLNDDKFLSSFDLETKFITTPAGNCFFKSEPIVTLARTDMLSLEPTDQYGELNMDIFLNYTMSPIFNNTHFSHEKIKSYKLGLFVYDLLVFDTQSYQYTTSRSVVTFETILSPSGIDIMKSCLDELKLF